MKPFFLLILFFVPGLLFSQNDNPDMGWWNELHDWQEGDPGWRNYIKITPGYLGPNALPVSEVKKGVLNANSEFKITASNHFHAGDPTQDISAGLYIPFKTSKVAVEMYGVMHERFSFSEEIRNERFARIEDGKGTAIGDFYFSTLIQLTKDKKFPNTLFRFATKTASGNMLEGARYTDSPGYFFDLSFSKKVGHENAFFQPFGLLGFYSWQTNDELNLQNDALMYVIGTDYLVHEWMFSFSLAGYSGYKNRRDRPLQLNFDMRRDWNKNAFRLQYQHGLRHWEYKTIRISFIRKFKAIQ